MIHEPLMNLLKAEMPDFEWTVNNFTEKDNSGTVYVNSESNPYRYEGEIYKPTYQVLIRSKDWDKAELYAHKVLKTLNKMTNRIFKPCLYEAQKPVKELTVELYHLQTQGGIIRIGTGEDKAMEYSINFDSVLFLIKEEDL